MYDPTMVYLTEILVECVTSCISNSNEMPKKKINQNDSWKKKCHEMNCARRNIGIELIWCDSNYAWSRPHFVFLFLFFVFLLSGLFLDDSLSLSLSRISHIRQVMKSFAMSSRMMNVLLNARIRLILLVVAVVVMRLIALWMWRRNNNNNHVL